MGGSIVLYVEDDDAAFALVRIILSEESPETKLLRARDGEEALALLRKVSPYQDTPRPDLILLDLNLPKKNGLEVLADVKANESLRPIPVVMFSTSASRHDRNESLALGAEDYVTKPSSFDLFVDAVKLATSITRQHSRGEKRESS